MVSLEKTYIKGEINLFVHPLKGERSETKGGAQVGATQVEVEVDLRTFEPSNLRTFQPSNLATGVSPFTSDYPVRSQYFRLILWI